MRVLSGFDAARGQQLAGCAVALGNFDGVHLGHRALFREAMERARGLRRPAVAATFEPHPGKVLAAELAPKVITPLPRKLELLEALGLDAVIVQRFDESYADLPAPEFLERDLFGALAPSWVVVGPDFTFGRGRGGTVGDLLAAGALYKAGFTKVEPVTCDGVVVSSTKIREFIAEGRVGAAARLLGRPFDVQGRVVHGEGRGRRLGFPTANLECEGEVRPRNGVYAVRAFFGGAVYAGAANIGRKPTFGKGEVTIEIFLFDFDGDLYGTPMSVEFLKRLRGEQRFSSVEELSRQISEDCEAARAALARVEPPGRLSPRA